LGAAFDLVLGFRLKPINALATEALLASKFEEVLLEVFTSGGLLHMIFSTSSSSLSVNSS
jgi:hypothetical protein